MSLYLGTTPIAVNSSSREIGEIIQSTIPLTDAGLHLLDGSVISGSGSYADFVTYIAGLVSNYPDLFTTETAWQSAVTTYGVCGKFVYDSTNNTVRLPKITGFTEGTTDVTALGDLVEAGLPNITGKGASLYGYSSKMWTGAFSGTTSGISNVAIGGSGGSLIDFNASNSNSIYGNSSTVQPQAVKVLYYIVIANSIKANIEVDIDEIATDLNGKADVDLSNVLPNIDYVIKYQLATAENNYTWYRVYKSGWVEQGGEYTSTRDSAQTIPLMLEMANTHYNVSTQRDTISDYNTSINGRWQEVYNRTTTSFTTWGTYASKPTIMWEVKGMAAQS